MSLHQHGDQPPRLFVYGTLARGGSNTHRLDRLGGTWQKAKLRGTYHAEGWGKTKGYPAVILNGYHWISGYVFSSPRLQHHWPALDEYEGEAYQRVITSVLLEDDRSQLRYLPAFIYTLHQNLVPESILSHPTMRKVTTNAI